MPQNSRRSFLAQTGAGAVALAGGSAVSAASASERITLGVIGTGGMGGSHVRNLANRNDVEIAYVCDVDSDRVAKNAAAVQAAKKTKPVLTGDMRKVLDDPKVDAVFIATPDHWHAPAAILALDAGKHVYVEKPCCHNIREGRLMADAVKRSGKLLQVGTQSRSTEFVAEARQRIQEGEIGDILVGKAWNSQKRGSIGKRQPSDPPANLDFDNWIGPAQERRYQSNLLHGIWRWWYDFGCGDIGNDGVHDIDVSLWGLGVTSHPSRVACFGEKYFFDDDQQFPDTQYAVFEYDDDAPGTKCRQFIFEQRIWTPYRQEGYENGSAFYGTKGALIMGHTTGYRLYGPRDKLIAERTGRADLVAHHTNFLECIRGNQKKLNADIQAGLTSAAVVHLANIAARTGRVLKFDPAKEQILNDAQANTLVSRKYRNHWGTPKDA